MKLKFTLLLSVTIICAGHSYGQKYKDQTSQKIETSFRGHSFTSEKSIAENLDGLADFSIFQELYSEESIQSLTGDTFMGTMFILSDEAFNDESDPEKSNLLANPANKLKLVKALIVPGRVDEHAIGKAVSRGGGRAFLYTLEGEKLGVRKSEKGFELFDSEGNTAILTGTNFYHRNGFFHLAEGIIIPDSLRKSD